MEKTIFKALELGGAVLDLQFSFLAFQFPALGAQFLALLLQFRALQKGSCDDAYECQRRKVTAKGCISGLIISTNQPTDNKEKGSSSDHPY